MGIVNVIRAAWRAARMAAAPAALLAGCASPPQPFPELPRLGVSTQLSSHNLCGLGVSPAIAITNAPRATTQYRVRMTNTDVLFQTPWQTTADATPGGFPEGALVDYQAPCVGDLTINSFYPYQQYRLEVLALDGQSRPLAYGYMTMLVYSVSATVDRERGVASRTAAQQRALPPPVAGPVVDPVTSDSVGRFMSPAFVPQMQGPVYQP
jgi:hypothetical protein